MLKLPDEKKKEIYEYVIALFKRYYDKRNIYDDRVFDWVRLYNSIPDTERNGQNLQDWEHNMFVPYIFANVETIKPRVIASVFQDPRYLMVEANSKDYIKHERNMTDWYLFKLGIMKFEKKMNQAFGDALIYPAAWNKVLIREDIETKKTYIDTMRVDYYDVWVDFAYRDKLRDVFHRVESNVNKLKAQEKEGRYENVDQLINNQGEYVGGFPVDVPQTKAEIESLFLSLDNMGIDKVEEKKEAKRMQKVEILEWWGSYDVDDSGYDKKIIVSIANRKVGIRIDEYEDQIPFFPIRSGKNTRVIYGRPVAQQLEMLQEELNELRSKRYDLLDRVLMLMFKARRTATIDWDTLFSAPDNVLLMDDIHDDLEVIEQKPLPMSAYEEETVTKRDIEFVSGARDFGGLGTGGTATGINAILSESATKFRSTVNDIVEDMLELINYIFFAIKKYASNQNESIKRFDSQEWITITPKELKGDYKIKVNVSNITTANKEMRIQLFINLLNIVGRLQGMVNIKEFVRMILNQADIKNVDTILQETPVRKARKVISKIRSKILKLKGKKPEVKTGLPGVINRITEPSILEKPLAAGANQGVQDPLMDMITGLKGGTRGK